jgi:hypothetical protein
MCQQPTLGPSAYLLPLNELCKIGAPLASCSNIGSPFMIGRHRISALLVEAPNLNRGYS